MEENLRRKIPKPVMDHEPMAAAGCRSGLTWRDSDSFPTGVDCSNDFSVTLANALTGPSMESTDEKRRLYLSSLEASFVNELHRYIGLHSCLQQIISGPHSSREAPPNHCDSSHEVTDSDGNEHLLESTADWGTIQGRNEQLLHSTADSRIIRGSPCVHHFASSSKRHVAASHDPWEHSSPCGNRIHVRMDSVVPDGLARSTEQQSTFCLFHQVVGSNTEASDQNFADERGEDLNFVSLPKWSKTRWGC